MSFPGFPSASIKSLDDVPFNFKRIGDDFDSRFNTFKQSRNDSYTISEGRHYDLFWEEKTTNHSLWTTINLSLQYLYGKDDRLSKEKASVDIVVWCEDEEEQTNVPEKTIIKVTAAAMEHFKKQGMQVFVNYQEL